MFYKITTKLVAAGIFGLLVSGSAYAAKAPSAFAGFCASNPGQCQVQGNARGPVQMDAKRWSQLRSVNGSVNRSIREVADRAKGSKDSWSVVGAGGSGDCEDFALTKRAKLLSLGWQSSALLMTVVRLPSGQGHAVLTVRTSGGDLVLDNLTSSIRSPGSTGYRFYTRQSESNPREWVAVNRSGGKKTTIASTSKTSRSFGFAAGKTKAVRTMQPAASMDFSGR